MTKAQKLYKQVNLAFAEKLTEAFEKAFKLKLVTDFNIFHMSLTSRRADGNKMTVRQAIFVLAFEAGYLEAMGQIK